MIKSIYQYKNFHKANIKFQPFPKVFKNVVIYFASKGIKYNTQSNITSYNEIKILKVIYEFMVQILN